VVSEVSGSRYNATVVSEVSGSSNNNATTAKQLRGVRAQGDRGRSMLEGNNLEYASECAYVGGRIGEAEVGEGEHAGLGEVDVEEEEAAMVASLKRSAAISRRSAALVQAV